MRKIYLDCSMGAAGDMLTAALLELTPDPDGYINRLNALGIPGVRYEREKSEKCGILGTHISVKIHGSEEGEEHHHEGHDRHRDREDRHHEEHHGEHGHHHHEHSTLHGISHIIEDLNAPEKVKADALAVYESIAKAESEVHGKAVDEIHFHEVGSLDAVADVAAVCMLLNDLDASVYASPVNTGSGSVKCAHGILPVPAPATANLLKGVSAYSDGTNGELCTPTGAALLKYFVKKFCDMPVMITEKTGYGMGKKDFEKANCLRAFLGEAAEKDGTVTLLQCNLDDMSGEALGFACEELLKNGALDVWTAPVYMKKNRPAVMLSALCENADSEKFARLIFRHTSTTGVRESEVKRYTLDREERSVDTPYGNVRIKTSSGYGEQKAKFEYDDIAKIARENGLSITQVIEEINKSL
ncbi:MAG: nickel pincer cofactor biosynthesis protein LarC [Clostridia bacterium]|nr:nickel pincer cofactor biosynthesis protein LarC [Clostridia bacterium]